MGFPSSFSFLGIGIPEVMLIIILALVVLGPERLPGVAKEIVKGFFRLRNLSKELTGQLEQELGVEELKELNELKDIKTGGLIEKWANDELDLNLDEDQDDSKAEAENTQSAPTSATEAKPADAAPVNANSTGQQVIATPPSAQTSPNGRNKVEVGSLIDSSGSSAAGSDTAPGSDATTKPVEAADSITETGTIENKIAPPEAATALKSTVPREANIAVNGAQPKTSACHFPLNGIQGRSKAALTRAWPSPNRTALRHPLRPVRMCQGKGLRGRLLFTRWR